LSFFLLHTSINLALGKTSLLLLQPTLLQDLAIHGFEHVIRRLLKGTKRKRGLSRAQQRKLINRKRRWFVDNIIMHHRRLQEINRQKLVSSTRERALARKKNLLNNSIQRSKPKAKPEINRTWQNGLSMRDRGLKIRGSVDTRKIRARSRWLTAINKKEQT
jgi:hypothetical protein